MRAKIGKYASEKGNLRAITHFKAQVSNLSESSVRTFKKEYERKLKEKKKQGGAHAQVSRDFYSRRHSWSTTDP